MRSRAGITSRSGLRGQSRPGSTRYERPDVASLFRLQRAGGTCFPGPCKLYVQRQASLSEVLKHAERRSTPHEMAVHRAREVARLRDANQRLRAALKQIDGPIAPDAAGTSLHERMRQIARDALQGDGQNPQ